MAAGTYTSAERVERHGRLVAFAGETMTMDEAAKRGLLIEMEQGEDGTARAKAQTKADLVELCKALRIDVPAKATKAEIEELLAAVDKADDGGADPGADKADDGGAEDVQP